MLHSPMARIDRIKEEIGLITFFVGACVTAIFANYDSTEFVRLVLAFINMMGSFIAFLLLMKTSPKSSMSLKGTHNDWIHCAWRCCRIDVGCMVCYHTFCAQKLNITGIYGSDEAIYLSIIALCAAFCA